MDLLERSVTKSRENMNTIHPNPHASIYVNHPIPSDVLLDRNHEVLVYQILDPRGHHSSWSLEQLIIKWSLNQLVLASPFIRQHQCHCQCSALFLSNQPPSMVPHTISQPLVVMSRHWERHFGAHTHKRQIFTFTFTFIFTCHVDVWWYIWSANLSTCGGDEQTLPGRGTMVRTSIKVVNNQTWELTC